MLDNRLSLQQTYFICATPRTGSTLLCSLLKSSGIAGQPESYFRKQDEEKWSHEWKIENCSFSAYLQGAIAAGQTPNGVLGVRIMWGTMEELVNNLRAIYPQVTGKDINVLSHAFGPSKFIYLKRKDFVAQAVSLLRAEQTDIWHITDDTKTSQPPAELQYDFKKIEAFVKEAEEHNTAWLEWFHINGIEPYTFDYETLSANPSAEALKLIDFLGLSLPTSKTLIAPNKRTSDDMSKAWMEQFRAEVR